jgi:hypothetical protein
MTKIRLAALILLTTLFCAGFAVADQGYPGPPDVPFPGPAAYCWAVPDGYEHIVSYAGCPSNVLVLQMQLRCCYHPFYYTQLCSYVQVGSYCL